MTTHMPPDRPACPKRGGSRRPGLTLIELLVVIAVIGVLCGILLPAVLQARTAGRKAACANNLKQLAAAVQQYHERNSSMPSYWGSNYGRVGGIYGGWLTHLMPDLDQQAFYDVLVAAQKETFRLVRGAMIRDAIPASSDYNPGTWQITGTVTIQERVQSGVQNITDYTGITIQVPIYTWQSKEQVVRTLVGQTGSPGDEAEYEWYWESTGFVTDGLPRNLGALQSQVSIPLLNCLDDTSQIAANEKVPLNIDANPGSDNWSLTNYQASAHAFMKFGTVPVSGTVQRGAGGRVVSTILSGTSTMGGRFPRPAQGQGADKADFSPKDFIVSGAYNSLLPRRFEHLVDGLSNTILFGEGMRQCDGTNSYRIAFLPAGSIGNEHAFGIEPAVLSRKNPQLNDLIAVSYGGFGNTLMFQTRPGTGCNTFRLQANHPDVLNVAMADGSVRGISSTVSRRERVDPDVAGRGYGLSDGTTDNDYNGNTYTANGLGSLLISGTATAADGVWDMLLMATDGADGNVLTNTGEVGKEK